MEQEVDTGAQYIQFSGALDNMFKEMRLRTTDEWWRQPGLSFGVGSCRFSAPERNFYGPASGLLISLGEQRLVENPHPKTNSPCRFHSEKGCVLGGLKNPNCIEWIDNPQELRDRFKLDPNELREFVHVTINRILDGSDTKVEFLEQALEKVDGLTEHVKRFPILHPEEVETA